MIRNQIDKLGKLVRAGQRDEVVLRLLADLFASYGKSAREVYAVVSEVLEMCSLPSGPSGRSPDLVQRSTKSLSSIIAKLARERTRLSSMHDIVGCRVIVENLKDQDLFSGALHLSDEDRVRQSDFNASMGLAPDLAERIVARPFREVLEVDRNRNPSSGYRAIHLVVRDFGAPYEIQIRTELQDRWAQLSERLNDLYPGIKYGHGPPDIQQELITLGDLTYDVEWSFYKTMELVRGDEGADVDHRFLIAQEQRAEAEIADLNRLYETFEEKHIR